MTKHLLVFMLLIFLKPASANKQSSTISGPDCLRITGKAVGQNNEALSGVTVTLYRENDEEQWVEVTSVRHHDHSFSFLLLEGQYYTIKVSRPGYVSRSIVVSTRLPNNVLLDRIFEFDFDVTLFPVPDKPNDDFYLDFPVAIISYNSEREVFLPLEAYTRHIKEKIRETLLISYN